MISIVVKKSRKTQVTSSSSTFVWIKIDTEYRNLWWKWMAFLPKSSFCNLADRMGIYNFTKMDFPILLDHETSYKATTVFGCCIKMGM